MNRASFLKKLGLGVLVASVAPKVIASRKKPENKGQKCYVYADNKLLYSFDVSTDCKMKLNANLSIDSEGWKEEISKMKKWSMDFKGLIQ